MKVTFERDEFMGSDHMFEGCCNNNVSADMF